MGLKAGLGGVAAQVGQARGFQKTAEYGRVLANGVDDRSLAIETFCAPLRKTMIDLEAYVDNVATSKSYIEVVRANAKIILSELAEMKQLALQSKNASATDRLSLQTSLSSKQAILARKLCTAEFGGVNLFTTSTVNNNFLTSNNLKLSANIDASSGMELVNVAGIKNVAGVVPNVAIASNAGDTVLEVTARIYGQATLEVWNGAGSEQLLFGGVGAQVNCFMSPNSVGIVNWYSAGSSTTQQYSRMVLGSSAGGALITQGGVIQYRGTGSSNVELCFYGAQNARTFAPSAAVNTALYVINGGVFSYKLHGVSTASSDAVAVVADAAVITNGATPLGALGTISIGTGVITPGTACTIDTLSNATAAVNIIEAAMDQVRSVMQKIDGADSALMGISLTHVGIKDSVGSAVEELLAADITDCMSEILEGQDLMQYTTAVWSGQQALSQLALSTFQKAMI